LATVIVNRLNPCAVMSGKGMVKVCEYSGLLVRRSDYAGMSV
jgi:hypothetical protein